MGHDPNDVARLVSHRRCAALSPVGIVPIAQDHSTGQRGIHIVPFVGVEWKVE